MLQTLKITNVALIDSAIINFEKGLNVISGETGAGKSIMLDALSFVFGGRADRTLIRENESFMQVEAIFSSINPSVKQFLMQDIGIECEDEIFVMRKLDATGKNLCKINGELVPVASVKKVCQMLVDLHGQSEHLSILDNDYQLSIIDLFSKSTTKELEKLTERINEIKLIDNQIKQLGGTNSEKQNLIDLYSYQINEIENAKIMVGEFESLQEEKRTMQQFEKVNNALNCCSQVLNKNSFNASASEQIAEAKKQMQGILNLNARFEEIFNRINSTLIEIEDISNTINEEISKNVFDEERFVFLDGRLDFLKTLFRKYGGNEESVLQYLNITKQKLDNLINGEEKRKDLQIKREEELNKIFELQNNITSLRKQSAKELVKKMESELITLGMPNAKMDVEFKQIEEDFSYLGADKVEFLFSSNLGFELKPLNKVVSGGEMSRVMLAYKIVVSAVDNISTILFDEIDSGLSGNIASTVAEYMARLSVNKQIIAISHLPQICAMADANIKVTKFSDNYTTHTKIQELDINNIYEEIARLMGVKNIDNGFVVAKEIKEKSNNFKINLKK